ncbi:MAG: hemerythrin domain-containing protein [Candidatus Nanopelagicales bacterium]
MTAPTDTAARPDTHDMVVVHRVFRRELRLLPDLVRAVPSSDAARVGLVADTADFVLNLLHHHHEGEDDLVWPLLHQRAPLHDDLVTTMEHQHQAVNGLLTTALTLVQDWRIAPDGPARAVLADTLDRLRTALLEHLDLEESRVLPLVEEHLSVAEWEAVGRNGAAGIPPQQLTLALGLILEDADAAETEAMLAGMPLEVRLMWRSTGHEDYAAHVARLRATTEPAA